MDPAAPVPHDALDFSALAREAAAVLREARALSNTLHLPGVRERHRGLLEQVLALAHQVPPTAPAEVLASLRTTLVQAHAARAEDARHGAGQLSLGAQRAPTEFDCDDGWERVEEVVVVAESSAREAVRLADELGDRHAWKAARAAGASAREARRIVEDRNRAYTFHTDPRFSFGEGWYLAAAALLSGVTIQVEPAKAQTAQAERFLRDAGLATCLQPYRSRPPANKPLPEIVARAFQADPEGSQRRLRTAFLGQGPIPAAIIEWADRALAGAKPGPKVFVWVRHGTHQPERNTTYAELLELVARAQAAGLLPILVGDAVTDGTFPSGAVDLTLFWKLPLFQGEDMRRAQLQLVEHLRVAHGLVGQVGVTTAGMDGPALLGLPTLYLTQEPNVRLGRWVGAVPGYQEVVRDATYLERVSDVLARWAAGSR